uniref:Uncharacterized protein n=1 Tax=Parascaris equorum TaxID=6256 RepID=A0A914RDI6_PAREQ
MTAFCRRNILRLQRMAKSSSKFTYLRAKKKGDKVNGEVLMNIDYIKRIRNQ